MPKATASTVATSNEPEPEATTAEESSPRVIAEWVGDQRNPRMKGFSKRSITKRQAKEHLLMELTRDLVWGPETHYRADVSGESEAFQGWLKEQKEFKVTEE